MTTDAAKPTYQDVDLILRLYDTAVGVATKAGREVPMPDVTTRACP